MDPIVNKLLEHHGLNGMSRSDLCAKLTAIDEVMVIRWNALDRLGLMDGLETLRAVVVFAIDMMDRADEPVEPSCEAISTAEGRACGSTSQ